MPVACQSRAPECPQAFGAQRLRGLRPSDYCCTSLAPVGAAINNGRSLLVFASQWSINYILKRNPGLELSETAE